MNLNFNGPCLKSSSVRRALLLALFAAPTTASAFTPTTPEIPPDPEAREEFDTSLEPPAPLPATNNDTAIKLPNPLNSNDKTTNVISKPGETPVAHNETNVVPLVGGSTDIGIGGGAYAGITRVKAGVQPYIWSLEATTLFTFLPKDGGGITVPYQTVDVKVTIPRFLNTPLRFELHPVYTWEQTLGYYGVGNASGSTIPAGETSRYFQYGRLHPTIDAQLRFSFIDHLAGRVGVRYTQNWIQVGENSKLASDIKSTNPEVASLVRPSEEHGVALFQLGMQWDNRDNEVTTHSGMFNEASIKLSPGGTAAFPYRYGQANLTLRGFIPVSLPGVTIAARAVADVLFGDVPFYELSRVEDYYALGGTNGVRGVPAQRFSGKIKVFGNVELRTELIHFRALGKDLTLSPTVFFDAGRVWADTTIQSQLDGTGFGMKYGVGGGVRLQSGNTFVLRFDLAWSPDSDPIGIYFAGGQAF